MGVRRAAQADPGAGAIGASTRRLAATRGVHLFLEDIETDRADHYFGTDHVARGAVEAERLGDLVAFLERRLHLLAREVLLDARDVETDFLGGGERARLVGGSAA